MRCLLFTFLISLAPLTLNAQTLDVLISDPTVFVDFDNSGPMLVDLEFLFQIESDAALVGQGPLGGDLFSNVSYTVSSNVLGLNGIASANLLDFELNPTASSSNDGFVLYTSGTNFLNGVTGFGGALNAFDGQAPFIVTGGSAFSQSSFGGLQTSLANGSLIDGSMFGFGFFGDTTISFTDAVPEPSSICLLTWFAGASLCRRKRQRL